MKALTDCIKGEAAAILGKLDKTAENYTAAIELLQLRFGDPLRSSQVLKGAHFASEEVMKAACTGVLDVMEEEAFANCFQSWKARMEKCVRAAGEYIEGYNI